MLDGAAEFRTAAGLPFADLARLPRWVAWLTEAPPGRKPTKVPYRPAAPGACASSTDPGTWAPRPQAEKAWGAIRGRSQGPGGVGLILGELAGDTTLGGIDLDSCRDPATGELAPWAKEVLERFDTYSEVSPSGLGVKLFMLIATNDAQQLRAEMGSAGRKWAEPGGGEHGPAIEFYSGGRFFAVTDQCLPDAPAELRRVSLEELRWLVREAGPRLAGTGRGEKRQERAEGRQERGNGHDGADDGLLARLHAAIRRDPHLARRWAGDMGGLSDGSRSGIAMALGAALKRAGFGFGEMCALLLLNEHTREWAEEKNREAGQRELHRLWANAASGEGERGEQPWPEPDLAVATAEPLPSPPWPSTLFPDPCRSWIDRAAERAGAPLDYVGCSLLSTAGAAIGNARWGSPWEGWAHPPVINVANVGLPSAGKSPGMEAAAAPLADLEDELNDDWADRNRDYRTAKQEAKERRAAWEAEVKEAVKLGNPPPREPEGAAEPTPPRKRRTYSTDPTMEAARDLSAANPRGLLLHRDELAGWIAGMDRYGSSKAGADRAFWLQAYEGRRWSSDRVKDGDDTPDIPHLTWAILGGFQPDRLASAFLHGDDDGLTARFLYAWPAPPADVSPIPDGRSLPFELRGALLRLRGLSMPDGEPVVLSFDEDARGAMQDWRREVKVLEAGATGLFLSWVGKLPGFAVRLAVIFAHLAWATAPDGTPEPDSITLDDLARALGFLAEYAVPMARRAFGEAALPEAERDARRLARWYLKQPTLRPAVLNASRLRYVADGPGIATSARITAALEELAALGWCRPAPRRAGDTAGRPRADWAMNPALREVGP